MSDESTSTAPDPEVEALVERLNANPLVHDKVTQESWTAMYKAELRRAVEAGRALGVREGLNRPPYQRDLLNAKADAAREAYEACAEAVEECDFDSGTRRRIAAIIRARGGGR